MPELRGEFIRGLDNGRGVDVGRVGGSAQSDTFQNITGQFYGRAQTVNPASNGAVYAGTGAFRSQAIAGTPVANTFTLDTNTNNPDKITFDASLVARTSAETRSRNIAMNHIIKI